MSAAQPVREPLPIIPAGPEDLFRVERVRVEGEWVRSSMAVGPWLAGPDGRVTAGSLGVLIDNVLGYAIIGHRPPDHWSVSTEIAMDVFGPVAADATRLHAQARVEHVGAGVGFASGRVVDDTGRLVAVCRQWGRFVSASEALEMGAAPFESNHGATDLVDLISAKAVRPTGFELEVTGVLQNPMHNLHGGIAICAAELASLLALADGPRMTTTSLSIVFPRPVPGGAALDVATTVRHRGRSLATVDVVGTVAGKPCTIAKVTSQTV